MKPPEFRIDLQHFWHDPYPTLAKMRKRSPICYVPELDATLMTRRDDIFSCEKMIDIFSSAQPEGLMTQLMGENMMRKDGSEHLLERRQAQPSLSPRTVKEIWANQFTHDALAILDDLQSRTSMDVVTDYAMPLAAHALRHITGLTNLTTEQMDQVSQAMIDGIANYTGDATIELRCKEATQFIDNSIDEQLSELKSMQNASMLRVLTRAGQPLATIRANIKLAISGGQNEPRDAIAGTVWALLRHPVQLKKILRGDVTWRDAFEEYARWVSPIGMSPRRIAKRFVWQSLEFEPGTRMFFMFGSANRDELIFEQPDQFDISRDTSKAISFGAGPHFCAGAAASRTLIADVALPLLFDRFPALDLTAEVAFRGWAFRGPLSVPVHA